MGLDRAPANLFSLKFPNNKVIGQLNSHPDRVVAQYSVWAIFENKNLSVSDFGVALKDIDSQPPNVRKYIYQTVATKAANPEDYYDYLVQGSEDDSVDARSGLATGLREQYFDAVEKLVLDWFVDETDEAVRQRLLEHMAAQSDKCAVYEKPVLEIYRTAEPYSLTRARLEAAARSTELHQKMKLIAFRAEENDLFGADVQGHMPSRKIVPAMETAKDKAQAAKVLIVTALSKEQAALKAMMDTREKCAVSNDPHLYELCTIGSGASAKSVIIASSGMGTLNASDIGAHALRSFPSITYILMVGIAGGCPNHENAEEHVRLGDVVTTASNGGVLQYDNVKATENRTTIRSTTQKPSAAISRADVELSTDSILNERPWETHIAKGINILGPSYARPPSKSDILHVGEAVVIHPKDDERRDGQPKVHRGVIAAADTLQKDPSKRDSLRDEFGVRAIEMEASGMQSAVWSHGKDIFVVRGVCDYCDAHKNNEWQNYAALAAAAYARALVERLPSEWF